MRTDYPNMFSPIEIRGKTCPNRTFFAPTHTGLGDPDSAVNDAVLAWMHVRAKGVPVRSYLNAFWAAIATEGSLLALWVSRTK